MELKKIPNIKIMPATAVAQASEGSARAAIGRVGFRLALAIRRRIWASACALNVGAPNACLSVGRSSAASQRAAATSVWQSAQVLR